MRVDICRVRDNDLPLPEYETPLSVGFDLRADFSDEDYDSLTIRDDISKERDVGHRMVEFMKESSEGEALIKIENRIPIIPTGFAYKIPEGCEITVRDRSGHSRAFFEVTNAPGTVDPDYIGELKVLLAPRPGREINIEHGERFAQAVISPVYTANFVPVEKLEKTERGDLGFGSTGED